MGFALKAVIAVVFYVLGVATGRKFEASVAKKAAAFKDVIGKL